MTSSTARANARQKAKDKARIESLHAQWRALLEKHGGQHLPAAEALALGGTEAELATFLFQNAG